MINLQLRPEFNSFTPSNSGATRKSGVLPHSGISDTVSFSSSLTDKNIAGKLKEIGDRHANNKSYNKAIFYYKRAIDRSPEFTQLYYNLARVYKQKGQTGLCIETYEDLLKVKPDEIEAQTLIGECHRELGNFEQAKAAYEKAIEIEPKYDFARRSLQKLENTMLAETNPVKANEIKQQVSKSNLKKALQLVNDHTPPSLIRGIQSVDITFDETDSLSGHKNIAQYENHNRRIVITSDYIWAAPEITAAYIIHEAVHAKDKDGLTSIREEQDAYIESIEFWLAHNNGIKDPELDYASGLYRENPNKLREKVAQTYRSRDASIPEYSPNHIPPEEQGFLSKLKMYFFSVRDSYSSSQSVN